MKIQTVSNTKTLVYTISNKLRNEIIKGDFKPREKIFEEEIAGRFKVSRAPIREAFRILEAEGMVNIVPRKGFYVADINADKIEALYAVRPMIEGLAAKLACKKLTDRDLEQLSKIISKMKNAAASDDLKAYFKLNRDFHECIYKRVENEFLCKILKNLENQALRYRFFAIVLDNRIEHSLRNHIDLYNALCKGDEDEVECLRRCHVENGGQALKQVIEKSIRF